MGYFRAILCSVVTGLCFVAPVSRGQQALETVPVPPAPPSIAPLPSMSNTPAFRLPVRRIATNAAPRPNYNYPAPPAYLAAPPPKFEPIAPPPNISPRGSSNQIATTAAYQQMVQRQRASTNIVFDAMMKEVKVQPGDLTADFQFSLTNIGPSEITIHSVRASCGCTTPKVPAMPWKLAPGESGSFTVSADLRGKTGIFQKTVMLDSTDGLKMVYVKVNIPAGAGVAGVDARSRNMQIAQADRQVVFRGDCASCHVQPAIGKMGESLFTAACGICHEAEHRATMVPDLHALKAPPTPAYWDAWIRHGKVGSLMPAFEQAQGGPLTDEQIRSLVDYLDREFPKRPRVAHLEDGGGDHAAHTK